MATMYRYGTGAIYEEIERTNMNHGMAYRTRALTNNSNKGINWSVAPGDQIRFMVSSAKGKVREIPASDSATTNEWFWGAVTSLTQGQIVKPLIGTAYDSTNGKYHATIPTGCNYFVIVTASPTYANTQVVCTVEKYVEGRGWIPVEPFIYDTNNGWGVGDTHKSANNIWS